MWSTVLAWGCDDDNDADNNNNIYNNNNSMEQSFLRS